MRRSKKKTLLWRSRRRTRKQSWVIITYLQLDMTGEIGDEEEEDNLEGFLLVL